MKFSMSMFLCTAALCLTSPVSLAQKSHHSMQHKMKSASLTSFQVSQGPSVNGVADDATWNHAQALQLKAYKISSPRQTTPVTIKSVHTRTHIYFLVRWKDTTRNDKNHKPWIWNAQNKVYEQGTQREDMLALAFAHTGRFVPDMLSGEPSVWDVWHWKAVRTNPQGYAMDKTHRYTLAKPSGKSKSYAARNGKLIWIARPEDTGSTMEKKQPAPTTFKGNLVPQYLPGTPSGSAADVRAKGTWKNGWWTLEFARKIDTGHRDDTRFDTKLVYKMAISVHDNTGGMDQATRTIQLSFAPSLPTAEIARLTGVQGVLKDGEYKIAAPQNDLDVKVDGFPIIPPMGTTSWVVFMPMGKKTMIMGDVVLLEDEFLAVQQILLQQGLTITAIHNHFLRDKPKVMFMHVGGHGKPLALARSVRAILDKVAKLRRAKKLKASVRKVQSSLNGKALSRLLDHPGRFINGVYKLVIGRPDVSLRDMGVPVTTFSGFNTWIAFQGTPNRAAVAGDFTMLAHEVAPVIRALTTAGIEVTAVHNHMIHEKPRIFFLHYWGIGKASALARGLKAALDAQRRANLPASK